MSISSVNGAGRVSLQVADSPAGKTDSSANNPTAMSATLMEFDEKTHQPVPLRFPWLSRLSAELEPVAPQKPSFPSAPQLGENLDQAA